MPTIELTDAEMDLLCEALDSHKYWQLSDKAYRADGYVLEPGSDDSDAVGAITACEALERKLASRRSD